METIEHNRNPIDINGIEGINEIAELSKYKDENFRFSGYDVEDQTQFYKLETSNGFTFYIEIISDNPFIKNESTLSDLINDKVDFFQLNIVESGECVKMYWYRPLFEKNHAG